MKEKDRVLIATLACGICLWGTPEEQSEQLERFASNFTPEELEKMGIITLSEERSMAERNIWLDGIFGVVVGDALGCPVEFEDRETRMEDPVRDMREYGTFDLPKGSWTDDSSMALAELDSIIRCGKVDLVDMMDAFVRWYRDGEYTPFGDAFDIGGTCSAAIDNYVDDGDPLSCGLRGEGSNGNGSLMRIMPVCLYAYANGLAPEDAIRLVHQVSALTHAHARSKMACGLYWFLGTAILREEGFLAERLQNGMDRGFEYYGRLSEYSEELETFARIRNVANFAALPEAEIASGGYVVDSLEATVWCLANTHSYRACTLAAVNLGRDTDTTAAIAGGLAGLYYGVDGIPADWLDCIQRLEWIEDLCKKASKR